VYFPLVSKDFSPVFSTCTIRKTIASVPSICTIFAHHLEQLVHQAEAEPYFLLNVNLVLFTSTYKKYTT